MPPPGSVLLDTNVVIAIFAGDATVLAALATVEAVYVPTIVLGELYYGARSSGRAAENVARIAAFAASTSVLPCDAVTAVAYGDVKADLRARGTPIPENDIWIAALARQHGLTLVTRDAHFDRVSGLALARWE